MSVGKIYRDFLVEKIIKASLEKGVILSKAEIEDQIDQIAQKTENLSSPSLRPELYSLSEKETSSASKMNTSIESSHSDLSVVYRSLLQQAADLTNTYSSVTSELGSVEKRLKELENKTGSLLLIAKNSEGYTDYLSDNFVNKDKVNLINTTISVDNTTGVSTLPYDTHNRISLPLIESDVQFNVISREQLKASTLAPGSSKLNAFNDQENIWLQRVFMSRGHGAVVSELILRMPSSTEVSKIVFKPTASDESSVTTLQIQSSEDGLNWINPAGAETARLIGDVNLLFSSTSAQYWKFVFTKAGYDEFVGDSYVYEFGAKSIQFFGVEYQRKENLLEGVLFSKPLTSSSGSLFNKVSLKTCESIPLNTSIDYSIAALTESELDNYNSGAIVLDDLSFVNIDPIDRFYKLNQVVVDFAKIENEVGFDLSYSIDDALDFRYKNRVNLLLDYTVPSQVLPESVRVFRNTGDNVQDGGGHIPVRVKGIDRGWMFDGQYYSCEFYIKEDAGKSINFGDTNVEINGATTTGTVVIPKGYHSIKTEKTNWRVINPDEVSSPTSVNPDILYPYNHKYLIEGVSDILYGLDLTSDLGGGGVTRKNIIDPDEVYSSVELYWEKECLSVSSFDFVNNIEDNSYFFFSFIKDFNGIDRIIIKYNDEPGLMEEEKLAIITRDVNSDLHKAAILKAVFKSEDPKATPVLDEYLIRLGY